jgi:hypothetical protein
MLIAQSDDPELLEWLNNASQRGGGFVSSLANAGLKADWENYPILRPVLLEMRTKYPNYDRPMRSKPKLQDEEPNENHD